MAPARCLTVVFVQLAVSVITLVTTEALRGMLDTGVLEALERNQTESRSGTLSTDRCTEMVFQATILHCKAMLGRKLSIHRSNMSTVSLAFLSPFSRFSVGAILPEYFSETVLGYANGSRRFRYISFTKIVVLFTICSAYQFVRG